MELIFIRIIYLMHNYIKTNNLLLNDNFSWLQFLPFTTECSTFHSSLSDSSFLCGESPILRWVNTISLMRVKHPNQSRVPITFQNSIFPAILID